MSHCQTITQCRFCDSKELIPWANLGEMPLVNNLLNSKDEPHELYPLKVNICANCTMSQLTHVVDPKILYSAYQYRSSMSGEFKEHCNSLARQIRFMNPHKTLKIVSIAENDGTFLENFVDTPHEILGIEPASNLCTHMELKGIPYLNRFLDSVAVAAGYGADYIVAQNVFAHVDNVNEFMKNCYKMLKDDGKLIIEVPWIHETIGNLDLGQVYHEHISYISAIGMRKFVEKFHMSIKGIKSLPRIHGGSLRFTISKNTKINPNKELSLNDYSFVDREWLLFEHMTNFQPRLLKVKKEIQKLTDHDLNGVCASAKGCILINYFGLSTKLDCIYDNTPEKIGKYQPGSLLEIKDFKEIENESKNLLVLSPNWYNEIQKNVNKLNPNLKLINPMEYCEWI